MLRILKQVRHLLAKLLLVGPKPLALIPGIDGATKSARLVLAVCVSLLPLCPMTIFSAVVCAVAAAPLVGRRAVAGVHHHHHLWEAGLYAGC